MPRRIAPTTAGFSGVSPARAGSAAPPNRGRRSSRRCGRKARPTSPSCAPAVSDSAAPALTQLPTRKAQSTCTPTGSTPTASQPTWPAALRSTPGGKGTGLVPRAVGGATGTHCGAPRQPLACRRGRSLAKPPPSPSPVAIGEGTRRPPAAAGGHRRASPLPE